MQRVGMSPSAARAEAVKNSLFPGAACMYLAGWDGIWQLRRQFRNVPLRQFHDRLLSLGSVPVSLAGWTSRESGAEAALVIRQKTMSEVGLPIGRSSTEP